MCNKTSAITDLIAENKLDVLAITETWLTGGPADEVVCGEIISPQYDLKHVTRVKRGGGVTALVNKALKVPPQLGKRSKETKQAVKRRVIAIGNKSVKDAGYIGNKPL